MVMATINASSLSSPWPAIFRGIHLNPLDPNNFVYLLWILMGYGLVWRPRRALGRLATCTGACACTTPGS